VDLFRQVSPETLLKEKNKERENELLHKLKIAYAQVKNKNLEKL